ncbi:MAG TPA: hypothetical protein VH079_11260 [Terriglobales bacterium]|nr:hypothetical protein [Terriglobales bacterium]
MKTKSMMRIVLAVVLSVSLLATGCSAQWISVALADLPVLTEMALNIASLVATLQAGKQLSPADAAAIQNISAEASRDLNLLETLYNQYKASPSAEGLQKIEDAIATINTNLPALLTAAHIGDSTLSARISAAVNLILTTVTSFASLIPQTEVTAKIAVAKVAIPRAKDLKKQWNLQVCGPTGKAALDAAFAVCVVK